MRETKRPVDSTLRRAAWSTKSKKRSLAHQPSDAGARADKGLRGFIGSLYAGARAVKSTAFAFFNVWGRPIRGAIDAKEMGSPEGASFIQRARDRWLAFMVQPRVEATLLLLALGWTLAFVFFVLAVIVLLFAVVFHVPMGYLSEVPCRSRCRWWRSHWCGMP